MAEVLRMSQNGDIEYVRRVFSELDPSLKAYLALALGCSRWKLSEVPDLPRWVSEGGRIVLLGDAAHGMLPSAAQV